VPGSGRIYRLFGNEEIPAVLPAIPSFPSIRVAPKTSTTSDEVVSFDEAIQRIDALFLPIEGAPLVANKQSVSPCESSPPPRLEFTTADTKDTQRITAIHDAVQPNSISAEEIINEVMFFSIEPKPRESLRVVCDDDIEPPLIIPFVKVTESTVNEPALTEPEATLNEPEVLARDTKGFVNKLAWRCRRREKTLYRKPCKLRPASEPMLAIDTSSFQWPEQSDTLMQTANNQIRMLADHLIVQSNQGIKAICFKGVFPGDGCSTVLLCAARALTHRGYRVLLIDAHHRNIDLPRQFNLSGNLDSANNVITLEEHLGLWVWQESRTADENVALLAEVVTSQREEYDLILLDDGSITECPLMDFVDFWDRMKLDGVVLVSNTKRQELPVSHVAGRLRQHHIHLVGVTENYV